MAMLMFIIQVIQEPNADATSKVIYYILLKYPQDI